MLQPKAPLETNSNTYVELNGRQDKMKQGVLLILYQQVCINELVTLQLSVLLRTIDYKRAREIHHVMEDKLDEEGNHDI